MSIDPMEAELDTAMQNLKRFSRLVEDRLSDPWLQSDGGSPEKAAWIEREKRLIADRVRIELPKLQDDLIRAVAKQVAKKVVFEFIEKVLADGKFAKGGIVKGSGPLLFSHRPDEGRIPIPENPYEYKDRPCGYEEPPDCKGLEEEEVYRGLFNGLCGLCGVSIKGSRDEYVRHVSTCSPFVEAVGPPADNLSDQGGPTEEDCAARGDMEGEKDRDVTRDPEKPPVVNVHIVDNLGLPRIPTEAEAETIIGRLLGSRKRDKGLAEKIEALSNRLDTVTGWLSTVKRRQDKLQGEFRDLRGDSQTITEVDISLLRGPATALRPQVKLYCPKCGALLIGSEDFYQKHQWACAGRTL